MNKFQQGVGSAISQGIRTDVDGYVFPSSISETIQTISTLHDNEMIAFAEWLSGEGWVYARLAKGWVNTYDDEVTSTTSELLTIFSEENK